MSHKTSKESTINSKAVNELEKTTIVSKGVLSFFSVLRKSRAFLTFKSYWNNGLDFAILGGMAATFGFAPYNLFPVFIAIFAWFSVRLCEEKVTLSDAFWFFTCFYAGAFEWIVEPLQVDLLKHAILIPAAIFLIPAYFAVQAIVAVWIVNHVHGLCKKTFLFPLLYSIVLYINGHGMFGFPWAFPAYIWSGNIVFLQSLSVFGVYGLNFVTLFMASIIGYAVVLRKIDREKSSIVAICSAFAIFFVNCVFGVCRLAQYPTQYTSMTARIVQPTIKHEEKRQRAAMLDRLTDLSKQPGDVDFIIWPEAVFPYLYSENLSGLNILLSDAIDNKNAYLIAGVVRENQLSGDVYNSAVVIDRLGRNLHMYDKVHLVPFGEYVPFRSILPMCNIVNDIGDFAVGDIRNRLVELNGLKILLTICYESAFSADYADTSNDSRPIDLMINLTNDGWFDMKGKEPRQHLQIVQARSIEMGVPLIRATNVGISAVFDPVGRLLKHIEIGKISYIDAKIPKKLSNQTSFALMKRIFN